MTRSASGIYAMSFRYLLVILRFLSRHLVEIFGMVLTLSTLAWAYIYIHYTAAQTPHAPLCPSLPAFAMPHFRTAASSEQATTPGRNAIPVMRRRNPLCADTSTGLAS
ncbi:hypothetical protein PAXRUDRAFT_704349 [Paxillus rubicundulus Ve08.2h10]|uniref:Uncharacterized protein n=1 Tax=Paxillus rubicundulus Ve08.2h10 TaxID=930991 RepID=A0A0D0DF89_9AGAM|nr:hypothetical protein PAXRUDRAFT_704349 [Paxillus rubicundulus Ve08.2h10]